MKKLHLLCNAHIDPIWQWEWEEGASAALSTFQSAVNLAEKYDYIFCHNEVTLYKYIESYAPVLFEKIKELIKQGKWHVMGGWYLQPDCLMPDGEGIVRQIKEGEIYFKEKFGVKPTTAVNFDPFGHSRGLVQIIKKCGQDSYIFMRPYSHHIREQLQLPSECFIWEGYDGSRIKARRVTEYNSALGQARKKIEKDIERLNDEEISISTWGVGNHGGGPSAKDLSDIEKMIEESDIEIVHSTPEKYFTETDISAIYDKSLISCMPGCYTSMIGVKQKYRTLERSLYFTEKLMSIAALKGVANYPAERLRKITEDMLNIQFHDILPGTVIRAGENNALTYANHGLHELNQIRADAFFGLCKGQPVAKPGTYPIMVFNPKTYSGKQLVECELSIVPTTYFKTVFSQIAIYDDKGNRIPAQTVKEASNLSVDWRKKVIFEAELNPLGITRFTAIPEKKANVTYPVNESIHFDNGEKKVFINARTGLIESYVVNGIEYANGKIFAPFVYKDNADPWGMSDKQRKVGIGEIPKPMKKLAAPDGVFDGLQSFEIIEDGDIYLGAEAFFGYGHTRLRIGYKIYKQGNAVDVDVQLFPCEVNKVIKLHIPTVDGEYIGDQVFGRETLYNDGRECIAHDYVAVKNGENTFLQVITPSTYASSYKNGEIRVTLHRGVAYCAHPMGKRPLLKKNIFIPRIDQGQCDYSFRLCVAQENELQKNANEFIESPYALNVFPTVDEKMDNGFEIITDNPNIRVVTIKQAVQTEGYLVRLFNNSENGTTTELTCGAGKITLNFGRFEVKTVLFNQDGLLETEEMLI